MDFLKLWHTAASTTLGLFWMAFWAFGLGYLISSMIQVFVTKERMQQTMGDSGVKSVALGSFFGFISSSCSFAALSTTRSLFAKGAGLTASLSFLLASTNLVIELGFVIAVFLGWQFVVGEYVGGVLLIVLMSLLTHMFHPKQLIKDAREQAQVNEDKETGEKETDWKKRIISVEVWAKVAQRYVMEWKMVYKDVTIGFTVAGLIAAFVPNVFFTTLFVGSGSSDPSFWQVLLQASVGPLAAFFTFIGSMGNIPLAAVLFGHGVSFAGIMAFIFSDLVVFPVLRIQAKYYGWNMAFYILAIFLVTLISTAVVLHYAFDALGWLPDPSAAKSVIQREFFSIDYTFFFNLAFIALSVVCLLWKWRTKGFHFSRSEKITDHILFGLSVVAYIWLFIGMTLPILL